MSYYVFAIDTDSYTGNFEREFCAHITNQIGECEVGDRHLTEIEDLLEDHPEYSEDDLNRIREFFEYESYHKQDDNGTRRPCSIYETPGRSNNGNGVHYDVTESTPYNWPAYESVALYFHSKPTDEVLEFMKKRTLNFPGSRRSSTKFNVLGCRLLEVKTVITETELWRS